MPAALQSGIGFQIFELLFRYPVASIIVQETSVIGIRERAKVETKPFVPVMVGKYRIA
jgi:hypothetical protein